jgi:hypothetical protein
MERDVPVAEPERAFERLARAQARTDAALLILTREVDRLRETLGVVRGELAPGLVPPYLARHHRIHVPGVEARTLSVNGIDLGVDLYGEGLQDGWRVVVIGEIRGRIHARDVERAARRTFRLGPQLPGTPVPVLLGAVACRPARARARELGVILIASSSGSDGG